MNKCLRITFSGEYPSTFFRNFIQKNARGLNIEGIAQVMPDSRVRSIACGTKGTGKVFLEDIEIEPFLKDKDYRGVFRVIE